MARYLEHEHQIFRHALRKFLEAEAIPFYEQWEEEGIIPRSVWEKLGANGFLCSWLDEKYGGLGADFAYSVVLNEEMERVGTGLIGVGLHNDIVVPYIATYGTEEQKQRWLPNCISGKTITAIAMTEPGVGSDLANITTTAIRDGDTYIVNGEKTFITNGIHADLIVCAVKTDPKAQPAHRGISLLVIEGNTPGFRRGKKLKKMGLHSQDTAELIFADARVPVANILGEEGQGFYYLMKQLQQERLIVAIGAIIAAEEMVKLTIDYVKHRKAFGKTIASFQNTQFKLAEMSTEIKMGRAFLDELIMAHMEGKEIVTEVSMAKWRLTDMAKHIAAECLQLHGGYGFMEEYPIARRFRDIQATTIYAGSNEIMKSIIAKNIGL